MKSLFEIDPQAGFGADSDGSVLERRPTLAILMARVIASWSVIESYVGLSATALLSGRSGVAEAVYAALSESAAQYTALFAAANAALSSEDAELFCGALRAVRKLGKGRHLIAHGIVLESEAVSDGLLIMEQRDFSELSRLFFTPPRSGESRRDQVRRVSAEVSRRIMVLFRDDLESMLKDLDRAGSLAMDASVLAAPVHHNKGDARSRLRSSLVGGK